MKKKNKFKPMPIAPISQPQISPDSQKILFTYTTLNEKEDRYGSNIWTVSTDGEKPKQFTFGEIGDSTPRWSPDGKDIIFISTRGKSERKGQIWTIPSEGGEARLLVSVPDMIVGEPMAPAPSWSPDGRKIFFLAMVKMEKGKKEKEKEKKSDVIVIKKLDYKLDHIGFFPDTRIHLFTVGREGGEPKQLTKGDFNILSATWSPDGKQIAFMTNMTQGSDFSLLKDLCVVSSEGGKPKKILEGIITLWPALSWSPDGKYIAFTAFDTYKKWNFSHAWIVSSKGGKANKLTGAFDKNIMEAMNSLQWSPDSKAVYFATDDHGCRNIYKANIKTHKVEKITEGKMRVSSFSLSQDGSTIAFDATEATRPTEVWIHNSKGDKRLTSLTDALVKDMTLIEQEEFRFKASDGAEVQGWIMIPVNFEKGEKYPAILNVHGGPWGDYGYGFDQLFQTQCANGYVVIFINHRASTGYGEAFSDITGHWGEREYNDLMEAVDFAIKKYPFIDANKLGVTGVSGGGYLTNWIVTHTDRFKAAVTVASISNWYSFYGCSDLGPCFILPFREIGKGKDPWDAPKTWLEKSPITYVKNVETPLLIIHGENDLRCPMEQAEQFFVALKKLDKTVEFVRFPGEPHANVDSMLKPSHATEAVQYLLNWFDKYLK